MKALKAIRLGLWALIVGACLAIVIGYTILSSTLLSKQWLETTARTTPIYQTIRHEVIAPQITAAGAQTDYTATITDEFAQSITDKTFDDTTLANLSEPVIDGTLDWLDHKSDTISFTIDATPQIESLVDAFANQVSDHVIALPDCTWVSTLEDIQTATCKLPFVTADTVKGVVHTAANTNSVLRTGQITESSFTIADSTRSATRNIPEYINQLYALTIFATGLLILSTLWLLLKHRSVGIATLGIGALIAASVLLVAKQYLSTLPAQFALQGSYQSMLQSAVRALIQAGDPWILWTALSGLGLTSLGASIWWLLRKRRTHAHTPHIPLSEA